MQFTSTFLDELDVPWSGDNKLENLDIQSITNKLSDRVVDFFEDYSREYPEVDVEVRISQAILLQVISNTYLDMMEQKKFRPENHHTKLLSNFLKAATFVKWFLKLKPLLPSYSGSNSQSINFANYLNEIFSLNYACSLSNIPMSDLSDSFQKRLLFVMRNRDFNSDTFSLLLEAVYKGEKNGH